MHSDSQGHDRGKSHDEPPEDCASNLLSRKVLYRAWATYDQVIRDFGPVLPFARIREAEQRHIDALRRLFTRYGLPVPKNSWPERVRRYTTLAEACEAGVAAEIANGAMYDRLLAVTR
jgi:hypothetical protein